VATLFPFFDIPVFWPILLVYFIILFVITMRRQIAHMRKYKSVPPSRPIDRSLAPAVNSAWHLIASLTTYYHAPGTCRSTLERRRITECYIDGGRKETEGKVVVYEPLV